MAKRLVWLSFLMLVLPLSVAAEPRHVLLLHSFEREFAPFDAFLDNFRPELSKNSPVPVNFYEVSLQLASSREDPQEGTILNYMHALLAKQRLDLVVPIGGPAVQFAQKNRQKLFPSTPMLLAAVDQRLVNSAALRPNDAVVSVLTDPSLLIDTILQILPQTTNIFVVIGNSQLDNFWRDELERQFQRFKGRLTFVYLNELSFEEILKRSAALPPNSVIYYQLLAMDAKGVSHAEARVLHDLHAVANAPIFGDQGYQLGQGVVGGPLLAFDDLSRNTAGVALRIMDGESPEHLRLAPQPPGPQIFDWRELRHWGISEDRLPPGSIVRFRELTVWERYKWRIIAALSVCLLEALLILALTANLSKRRRAERLLSESTNRLGAILSTAADGILTFNERGVIDSVNAAAADIFGYTAREMLGRNVSMVLPAPFGQAREESVPNDGQTISPDIQGAIREASGRRKDSSLVPIELAISDVVLADRRIFIGFVRDITERKRDQEALQRSHAELERRTLQLRRLASQLTLAEQTARKQLASTLHDGLQQLLFTAGMTLDQAMRTSPQDDQTELLRRARADLKEAMEAARTLSVSLFPPVLHVGGLPAALSWLARRTQQQYNVVVNVTAEPLANPDASDIRILLYEAVRELLFNAVKHARAGRININLALGPADTIYIQVSDDGIGFDPKATLDDKNHSKAGLGLFSIQERLVALLGGHLDIRSAPGKGAQFTLTLPRTALPRRADDGTEAPRHDTAWQERLVYDSASGASKSLRILIADDHAVTRAGLRDLFGKRPQFDVVGEAGSGVEAITQAVALQPDVIVMDVSLPQMNGIHATREIHRTLQHIRIVGLSTHDDESTERLMRKAGAEAYFNKNEGTDRLLDYLLFMAGKGKVAAGM